MMKHTLAKYLMCGAAASAFALVPFSAQAQGMTSTTTTTMTTTTVAEPTMVSGTVVRYYVDQTGYVTAADVQTADGVKMVHFPANRASYIYTNAPVGGNVNLWVSPSSTDATYWNVVGWGQDRPGYWWNTTATTDMGWLKAEPYIMAGAKEVKTSGTLKGVVTDENGEILALVIDGANGWNLVRVPPELRQIAPDHTGDARITPLFKNADVQVVGVPEATRVGGLMGYSQTIAANTIRINGDTVGSIGLPARKVGSAGSLFDWNFGGVNEMNADELRAYNMGYRTYVPVTSMITTDTTPAPATTSMTTTTTTTTSSATGQVKIVAADGTQYPVVQKDGKLWAQAADGTLTRIKKENGKYVVPASMAGSRMVMVMADGSQMNMDTVNGQLMVIMADGSMAPVTLHTP